MEQVRRRLGDEGQAAFALMARPQLAEQLNMSLNQQLVLLYLGRRCEEHRNDLERRIEAARKEEYRLRGIIALGETTDGRPRDEEIVRLRIDIDMLREQQEFEREQWSQRQSATVRQLQESLSTTEEALASSRRQCLISKFTLF